MINDNFGTIVFCRRYLERLGVDRYLAGVRFHYISDCLVYLLCTDELPCI